MFKCGNSLYVPVPRIFCRDLNLVKKSFVSVRLMPGKSLVVQPFNPTASKQYAGGLRGTEKK